MAHSIRSVRKCLHLAGVLLAFTILGHTQATGPYREVLTNKSIVTLAAAGFDEEFIIETIATSRSHFDVTVDGLAGLAKQGINERIIRVMMNGSGTPEQANVQPAVLPPDPDSGRPVVLKPRAAPLAIVSRTPYYETHSYLWGLFKKRVGVGVAPQAQNVVVPHLGAVYQRMMAVPAASYIAGQYAGGR